MSVLVVMYHYVHSEGYAAGSVYALNPAEFERQLEGLLARYAPAEVEELEHCLEHCSPLPKGRFLLTFDDGTWDHYSVVLPVLDRLGLRALFFPIALPHLRRRMPHVHKNQLVRARLGEDRLIERFLDVGETLYPDLGLRSRFSTIEGPRRWAGSPLYLRYKSLANHHLPFSVTSAIIDELFTECFGSAESAWLERWSMSEDQLRVLVASGHALGSHSVTHRSFAGMSAEEVKQELTESLDWLARLTGRRPRWFSYPYGDVTPRAGPLLRSDGVLGAFAHASGVWTEASDPTALPRFDCREALP
jgi:peptidoglycan/xylan/chitin deacetylase (PgdA/CDA1 family)